jgi:hypothetical protein
VAATHSAATIYVIGATSGGGQGVNSGIDYLSGTSYSGVSATNHLGGGGYTNFYNALGAGAGGAAVPALGLASVVISSTTYPAGSLGSPGPGISGFGIGGVSSTTNPKNNANGIISTVANNSGAGGSATVAGKSGIVILSWFE